MRKAVSLGGDSDTIACIAGGIAEAYFGGLPEGIMSEALVRLDDSLRGIFDSWCTWMTGGND